MRFSEVIRMKRMKSFYNSNDWSSDYNRTHPLHNNPVNIQRDKNGLKISLKSVYSSGPAGFMPPSDEISEALPHCLPRRQLGVNNLSMVAVQ